MAAPRPTEPQLPHPPKPVPTVILERFRRGELPPDAMRKLQERCEHDPDMRAALAALAASDAEILASLPPEIFLRQLHQRDKLTQATERMKSPAHETTPLPQALSRKRFQPKSAWLRPAFSLAVASLIALPAAILYLRQPAGLPFTGAQTEQPSERLKGLEPKLVLFRKALQGAEPLHPGDPVGPGAILRIGYQAAGLRYGAILSCDGNGQVTVHFPVQGEQAATLEAGESLLPTAYELDAAPEYERFFLVTADTPFTLAPLRLTLARDRDLTRLQAAHPSLRTARFDLRKESSL
jgi:anti-sigma factor RsiW